MSVDPAAKADVLHLFVLLVGYFVALPVTLVVVGWWFSRVYARPSDERPRPKRRAESMDGSE